MAPVVSDAGVQVETEEFSTEGVRGAHLSRKRNQIYGPYSRKAGGIKLDSEALPKDRLSDCLLAESARTAGL